MSSGSGALSLASLRRRWTGGRPASALLASWSAAAAVRAVRTTVVMPGLFALTLEGFGNTQMALFAGFGSFATLVLVSFSGSRRDVLAAHGAMALGGSVLLIIGTAVSSSTALAAAVTVPVTFAVFFSGVLGPNAASGVIGTLLAYVLPAASPGTLSMIPDRLAGWWLASIAGTIAVLALPTPPADDGVRSAAAKLASALASELEALVSGAFTEGLQKESIEAKRELLARFGSPPSRPIRSGIEDQAVASAIELLEWCAALIADSAHERADLRGAEPVERELLLASAAVLRDAGGLLAGSGLPPDLDQLDERRRQSLGAMRGVLSREDFENRIRVAFHTHTIAITVLAIGADALIAAGIVDAEWIDDARTRWFEADLQAPDRRAPVRRYAGIAAPHASVRSVWFVNSVRGALALAAAVAVAGLSGVQHGFWVVLGTLSVLRTNAAATGATALRALLGTVAGFAIGGVLLLAIGTSAVALWVVLPIAVLVASYAPGTAPFAVGQAAFTITVAVLFNLLVPVGWKVGELRIEDVAIGCAVSVLFGSLLWPRGVAPLVGDDLADAYRAGAAYLREAVQWVFGQRREEPAAGPLALTTQQRVDAAVRAFFAEQGTKHMAREELWRLIGGTQRLRLTAHAIASLPCECARTDAAVVSAVADRTKALSDWYEQLAAHLGRPSGRGLEKLAEPPGGIDGPGAVPLSRGGIWLHEHLDHLSERLGELVEPAMHLGEVRRRPWWR